MAEGPGKYDDEVSALRLGLKAQGIILVVVGGRLGSGFSVQMLAPDKKESLMMVSAMLKEVAAQMDTDAENLP